MIYAIALVTRGILLTDTIELAHLCVLAIFVKDAHHLHVVVLAHDCKGIRIATLNSVIIITAQIDLSWWSIGYLGQINRALLLQSDLIRHL